eukprot:1697133-Amphidinium_carterae.2
MLKCEDLRSLLANKALIYNRKYLQNFMSNRTRVSNLTKRSGGTCQVLTTRVVSSRFLLVRSSTGQFCLTKLNSCFERGVKP